jgi:muramoyltetrapeptide carboxypeptidase
MRIVDDLDADALRADPKLVVGFSDVTVLLAWALAAGVRPVHGPVVTQLGELPAEDVAALHDLVEQPAPPPPIDGLVATGAAATGPIEGRLTGGNLSLVAHLVGTRFELDLRGAIFLVEDVDEKPYGVDRYFTRLALARAFAGCRAVVAGDFHRCEGKGDVLAVLDERLRAFDLPGARGLPLGHAARNRAVPIGARCALDVAAGRLVFVDGAVR